MKNILKILTFFCAFLISENAFSQSQNNNQSTENSNVQNSNLRTQQTVQSTSVMTDMIPMDKAKIRILDKQLGRVKTATITIGETYKFDNLEIMIRACYTNKEYDTPENIMFISTTYNDSKYSGEQSLKKGNTVFSGWMFSSSPSLSAMEHSVYDIWLLVCEK